MEMRSFRSVGNTQYTDSRQTQSRLSSMMLIARTRNDDVAAGRPGTLGRTSWLRSFQNLQTIVRLKDDRPSVMREERRCLARNERIKKQDPNEGYKARRCLRCVQEGREIVWEVLRVSERPRPSPERCKSTKVRYVQAALYGMGVVQRHNNGRDRGGGPGPPWPYRVASKSSALKDGEHGGVWQDAPCSLLDKSF
jgi:hypothetical protein